MNNNINKTAVTNEEENNNKKYFTGNDSVQSKGKIDIEDFKDPYSVQKFVFLDKIESLKNSQKVLYYLLKAMVLIYFETLTLWYHLQVGKKLKKLFKVVIHLSFSGLTQLENYLPSGGVLSYVKEELSLYKQTVHKKILKDDEISQNLIFKYETNIHPLQCLGLYLVCIVRVLAIITSELMVLLVDYIFTLIKNASSYKYEDNGKDNENETESE